MTDPKPPKQPPVREWVLTPDMDTVRNGLSGMMGCRKFTHTKLALEMGTTSSSMFSAFLRGQQAHIRTDSFLRAAQAMGFEVVIREPQTTKTQRRLALLKEEKEAARKLKADELAKEIAASPEVKAEWAAMVGAQPSDEPEESPGLRAAVEKMLAEGRHYAS